jgi:hypothetical protein
MLSPMRVPLRSKCDVIESRLPWPEGWMALIVPNPSIIPVNMTVRLI